MILKPQMFRRFLSDGKLLAGATRERAKPPRLARKAGQASLAVTKVGFLK